MSSSTQARFQTVYEVSITGSQAVSLDKLLGQGGRDRVRDMLDELVAGERFGCAPETQAWLAWKRRAVGEEVRYQLSLPASEMTAALRGSGIDELEVGLAFGGGSVLQATHACRFRSGVSAVPKELEGEVARLVNRSINNLLSLTVARTIKEKLKAAMPVQGEVRQKVTNQLRVENLAFVRTQMYVQGAQGRAF